MPYSTDLTDWINHDEPAREGVYEIAFTLLGDTHSFYRYARFEHDHGWYSHSETIEGAARSMLRLSSQIKLLAWRGLTYCAYAQRKQLQKKAENIHDIRPYFGTPGQGKSDLFDEAPKPKPKIEDRLDKIEATLKRLSNAFIERE